MFRNFTKNDRRYEILAEYNTARNEDGIYYGIMCKDCHNDIERKYLNEEWNELRAAIHDSTKLVFGEQASKAFDNIYWVLWIRLKDSEPADCVSTNIKKIIRFLEDNKERFGIVLKD